MRSASVSVAIALAACATSPPPLPPHRPIAALGDAPSPPSDRPPDVAVPAAPPVRSVRYAWATLAADLVSIYPLVQYMVKPEQPYLALPALFLVPAIHVGYGESDKAVLSLVLRGAMVAGVYAAGREADSECRDPGFICIPLGPILLANLAITTVVTADAVFLARTTRAETGWSRLPVLPTVSAGAEGTRVLGVSGAF